MAPKNLAVDETVGIRLEKAAALVLSDLLFRWEQAGEPAEVRLEHDAEWHALWLLSAALDPTMVEIVRPDYAEQVARARQALVERGGAVGR